MKKKLSLARLSKNELKTIKAGFECSCSCWYQGACGSSVEDNNEANTEGNLQSIFPPCGWECIEGECPYQLPT